MKDWLRQRLDITRGEAILYWGSASFVFGALKALLRAVL